MFCGEVIVYKGLSHRYFRLLDSFIQDSDPIDSILRYNFSQNPGNSGHKMDMVVPIEVAGSPPENVNKFGELQMGLGFD